MPLTRACWEVEPMPKADVTTMPFAKLYPLLVAKAERKGRTREEVDLSLIHI